VPKTQEPEFHATHPMWNLRVDGALASYDEAALRRLAHPDAVEIAKMVDRLNPKILARDYARDGLDLGTDDWRSEQAAMLLALDRVHDLVIVHARLSTMPDLPDERRPYPVRSANSEIIVRREKLFTLPTAAGGKISYVDHELVGTPSIHLRAKPSRGRYPHGSVCPLKWIPDWPVLVRERAEYLAWRLAIRRLARSLQNLDRVAILSSRLPLRPWS
jgi:hypothetical protein